MKTSTVASIGSACNLKTLQPNPEWAKLPLFDHSKWQRVRFGDVVRVLKEQVDPASGEVDRYVAGDHMETENVHIRRWGNVGDGYLGPAFIRRFRKGQVLYGSRRTYLKKVALAEWDGVTSNTTLVLEAVEGKLLQELLPWLMLSQQFTRHSVQESKGSTNPYINWPDIAKFEFDLPPLAQQRRIAEILWAIDSDAQSHLLLKDAHRDHISSVSHAMFSSENGTTWRPAPLQDFAVSKGIVNGPFGSDLLTSELQTEGIPVIYVRDIKPGRYRRVSTVCVSSEKAEELQFCDVRSGDVLVAKVGEPPCDAAPYLDSEISIVTQDVIRIRPRSDTDRGYLVGVLNSSFGRAAISRITIGGGRMRVSLTNFKTLAFPKPPLEEQRRISAILESGEQLQITMESHLMHLKSLQTDLIERLMAG